MQQPGPPRRATSVTPPSIQILGRLGAFDLAHSVWRILVCHLERYSSPVEESHGPPRLLGVYTHQRVRWGDPLQQACGRYPG